VQLSIDTSTETASVALTEKGVIQAELTWRCGRNHTVELYPGIDFLLKRKGVDARSLDGIIVATGPGSFNGLRVGVSAAKGLAFSLGIPIVGIGTLEVCAYPHLSYGLPVCAVTDAGRSEIAAAVYKKRRKEWAELSRPHLTTIDSLASEVTRKTIICGEFSPSTGMQIQKLFRAKAIILLPAARLRRAGFLAELGMKRMAAGDLDSPSTLQPMYLRRPPITERKEKS
jgi:tRNA threonylcarbamoyl adenosine modification protein YeaZ